MANYNIIGRDQKQYGPIAEAQLRQWIAEGRVDAQTKIQTEGAVEWKLLTDFPEFRDVQKTSTPPPLPAKAGKTSGMAITSLVLGILGLVTCGTTLLLTAPVGLILGIISMTKIGKSQGDLKGRGLALAGIITSGVSLLLIPIFAAMLLPALAAAKRKAQAISCVNNEMQLALAVKIYSRDHTNHCPPAAIWCDAIKTAVFIRRSGDAFKCPAANPDARCDYAFNAKLDGLDINKVNPQTVMLFESDGGWNANGGPELMIGNARHARMFVVALADGSVQQLRESQLGTLRWDP